MLGTARQTSPPIRGYPKAVIVFIAPRRSRALGSRGQGGCSRSHLGLAASSHSPNFLAEWAAPGMPGLGHVKNEGQRRGAGEEGNVKTTAFLQSCQDAPAWGFFPPLPILGGSPPHCLPACHSSAGVVLRYFRESIPETSKPPPGRMTCRFSETGRQPHCFTMGRGLTPSLLFSSSPLPPVQCIFLLG